MTSFPERHSTDHFSAGFNETHNMGRRGNETADEVTPLVLEWIQRQATQPVTKVMLMGVERIDQIAASLIQARYRSADDYCWVLGLRNSHDKTFPAGVVAGASVFVCDNLSFSGEVKLSRKHTTFIVRDLPQLVERGIGRMLEKWHSQHVRFEAYKNQRLNDTVAHDLVIRSVDVGVCSNRYIPSVLHQWREPEHDTFERRNVWSLFNAFTAALKEGSLAELPKRTEALHALLDSHVGLAFGRS